MTIDPELKQALLHINFAERYRALTMAYLYDEKSMESYTNKDVIELIRSFGYEVKYYKNENFFKILEELPPFQFQLNISCKYGLVELIFGVLKNNIRLTISGPWNAAFVDVTESGEKVKRPAFKNYEDLRNIFKNSFEIYGDFKKALLAKNEHSN